jgi:hypothetical protein
VEKLIKQYDGTGTLIFENDESVGVTYRINEFQNFTPDGLPTSKDRRGRVTSTTGHPLWHPITPLHPGPFTLVHVWFIEGLDLWSKNMLKMEVLSPEIDALQRVATKHNVCVLATVGAPKMRGDDRYFGRDALYGSSVLARKVETVILVALTNREDADSVRQYDIYPRNGKMEKMFMKWEASQGLVITEKPPEIEPEKKVSKAMAHMARNCFHKFKPGDEVVYSPDLGANGTFYRWRDDAVDTGQVVRHSGGYRMGTSGSGVVTSA